jgi:hypothetical protein
MNHGTAWIAAFFFTGSALLCAECLPFDTAPQHIGEIVCVRGRVVKVSASAGGTHYLNFCENYLACPFTVVVLPKHLEEIGDVRSLQGREIEIDGLVKLYNGRPEILLTEPDQLHGDVVSHIPPLPKNYDVAEHGRFSAGSTYARRPKRAKRRLSNPKEEDPFADPTAPD